MGRTGIGLLWLCFCCAIPTSFCQLMNVANESGKIHSQISYYDTLHPASFAANGDTGDSYTSSNCIHTTTTDHTPWWQVDLRRKYPVYDITLWARSGCRLYPLNITVDGQLCVRATNSNRHQSLMCTTAIYGQVVRLTRDYVASGRNVPLNLCEVQIWVCPDGKYGNQCSSFCSSISRCSGRCYRYGCTACSHHFKPPQCTGCDVEYYKSGSSCVKCSSACVNRKCNPDSGRCDNCASGFYKTGTTCVTCSSNCVDGVCRSEDGRCTSGCIAGWYGDKCDSRCSTKTPGCSQCAQDAGQCTVCQTGFYKSGSICAQCSSNCTNRLCDLVSGRCTEGCIAGWYGDKCDSRCSTKNPGCSQCVQNGGQCTVCQTGFYKSGSTCAQCSSNCTNRLCDLVSGRCTEGCIAGWYGDKCDSRCSTKNPGCSQCVQNGGQCTVCQTGFYKSGSTCAQCSSNCTNRLCDSSSGSCTEGCIAGWYGGRCDLNCSTKTPACSQCVQDGGQCTVCTDGFYKNGTACSECTWKCDNDVPCNKTTGHCAECPAGRKGDRCTEAITGDDFFPSAVVGSVVGVLLAIIIAVVIVFVVFKWRRRQRANKSNGAPGTAADMSSNMEGLNDSNSSNDGGRTLMSFDAVAVEGDPRSKKPKEDVKPKPAVKPKPSKPAQSNIYENVPTPGLLAAEPTKPADKVKASAADPSAPPSNGKASGAANGKKPENPPTAVKPVKKKAARVLSETPSEPEEFEVEESVYANDPNYFDTPGSLVLGQLRRSVTDKLLGDTLEKEFGHLTPVKDFSTANGDRTENYYKNRFRSIVPYDWNRIELEKVGEDDASDYVNASLIKGYKQEKKYIASQGPKDNTRDDFWRMVWQEKVTDIVMLTNLKEGKKDKCCEYWPQEGATLNLRHMQVAAVGDVETRAHFVIRTFNVKHKQGKERRRVTQYHYVSWMDHQAPETTPLVNFWRYVRARVPRLPSAPPLLVHCSAGVGRTGTFIALDITIDESEQASEVNLFNIVHKLRDDRCHMVQNKDQYVFLHEAILEAYTSQNTRVELTAMGTVLPIHFDRNTPNTKIDAEYEMLCKMRNCPTVATYTTASLPDNAAKNRNPDILPSDKHLVYVTQYVRGRNQYINGVSMATFLQHRGSIMTQLPLPDTVVDLWRLVDGAHVKLIVSIGDVEGQKDLCCYWPKEEGKPLKTGPYVIKIKSSASIGDALRSYTLTMDREGSSTREVRLLHYSRWTGECADDTDELIHLLTSLQSSDQEMGDNPVIVQCIDGSLRSGVLCALWDVVSRMALDEELDVYLAARQVTIARPQAFVSVKQYRYCYEVAQQIKNSYNVYSNM